ncbi:MAG: hypothetical protein II986_06595 [Alistipes sp.]|nr:hypothetical protein [Alistipes sp.]
MKKFSVICGLALALLTAGCTNDTTEGVNPTLTTSISVSLDQTRTYLGEIKDGLYPILWSEGDKVAINGVATAIPAAYVGQNSAYFEGVAAADDYSLFYPATLLDTNSTGKNIYTISDVQTFVEGSFAENSSILVGYAKHAAEGETKVSLKNVYGYLKINITSAADVEAVYVSAAASEAISGTFEVDYDTAAITPVAGNSIIRVMGVKATGGVANVVVAVPAGKYADGFIVKILDKNNRSMTKTIGKTDGVTIERAQLYTLPSLAYSANSTEDVEINDATELQAFLTAVDAGDYAVWVNANGEVVLGNDVDLTGVTLTCSASTGDAAFAGVFNGQGYALKNWTTSSALFADNKGTIKNIVFDSSCKWTPATGDQALLVTKNNGIVSGITANVSVSFDAVAIDASTTIGTIVARSYKTVENCVNNGNISITNIDWTAGNLIAGGVVGYGWYKAGETLVGNCVNNGNITFSTKQGVAGINYYVGGVLGATSSVAWDSLAADSDKGIIINCLNTGDVSCSRANTGNGTYANIGGIAGYVDGDLVNCVNEGNVSYLCVNNTDSDTAITRTAVGGVVAACTFSITDCINRGKVTVTGTFAAGGKTTTQFVGRVGDPCVGGVVAQVGNVLALGDKISGCYNYGELDLNCTMRDANESSFYAGGVIAVTHNNVENCHNYGKATFGAGMKTHYLGGVVARTYQNSITISKCTNNAPLSFKSTAVSAVTPQNYFGAVCGYGAASLTIDECSNSGSVTVEAGHVSSNNSYAGGIVGQASSKATVKDSENSGDINIIPAAKWRAGGISANVGGTILRCTNTGNLTATSSTSDGIGGIVGFGQANITNCTAKCTITGGATAPCGGLVGGHGNTAQSWNGNTIKINITTTGAYRGIFCGSNTAANDGAISTIGDASTNYVLSGSTLNGTAVTADDCSDLTKLYGNITNDGHGVLGTYGVTFKTEN